LHKESAEEEGGEIKKEKGAQKGGKKKVRGN